MVRVCLGGGNHFNSGMENFEAIRNDPKLCFIEKKIEEMPTTIELNTRFKRIILTLSRKLEMALLAATNAQTASKLKRSPFTLFYVNIVGLDGRVTRRMSSCA